MTPAEFEALLQQAFTNCEMAGSPLTAQQQEILRQTVVSLTLDSETGSETINDNPLDELSTEQRQLLLEFVATQEQQNLSWKVQLLNDWLAGQSSGSVQFLRDQYGVQWLERIQPVHLAQYADSLLKLKVGDRIEVCNALWEWVPDDQPETREWFPCTVVSVTESVVASEFTSPSDIPEDSDLSPRNDSEKVTTGCIIRFENGREYEIQGVYEWNQYNWRWVKAI